MLHIKITLLTHFYKFNLLIFIQIMLLKRSVFNSTFSLLVLQKTLFLKNVQL